MHDTDWIAAVNAMQGMVITLWTVYLALVAAIMTLIVADRPALRKLRFQSLIAIGYVGASIMNLWAMLNLRDQHDIAVRQISSGPPFDALKYYMLRPTPHMYIAIHIGLDLGVCLAIFLLPQLKETNQRPQATPTSPNS